MNTAVSYRTVQVDDLSIFYREAGPKDAPALLLLHGLPYGRRMDCSIRRQSRTGHANCSAPGSSVYGLI